MWRTLLEDLDGTLLGILRERKRLGHLKISQHRRPARKHEDEEGEQMVHEHSGRRQRRRRWVFCRAYMKDGSTSRGPEESSCERELHVMRGAICLIVRYPLSELHAMFLSHVY